MLLKLQEPKFFADIISLISELVLEVKARVNKEGLNVVAIDPTNVAMVILKIPSHAFSQFQLTKEDKEEELGLNLEDLKQVLRRASSASSLVIERQENMLKMTIEDKQKRNFNLSLINVESEDKKIPDLSFTSKILLDTETFSEAINDSAIVSDSCSLLSKNDKFIVEAKGTLNSTRTEFSSDEINIAGDAKAKYSIDYLAKFIKASKLADKVAINFSDDYPARFDFKSDKFELSFILAPRMEEE